MGMTSQIAKSIWLVFRYVPLQLHDRQPGHDGWGATSYPDMVDILRESAYPLRSVPEVAKDIADLIKWMKENL